MKLDEYQQQAVSLAIYPKHLRLLYPTLGLCGEIGEVTKAFYISEFDNAGKEIGDVLWYCANVAHDIDLTLSELFNRKTFRMHNANSVWDCYDGCERLCIQSGIVAENVKKAFRDNQGVLNKQRRQKIKAALKEIIGILSALAVVVDSTLEKEAIENIEKLNSRKARGVLSGDGDNR